MHALYASQLDVHDMIKSDLQNPNALLEPSLKGKAMNFGSLTSMLWISSYRLPTR